MTEIILPRLDLSHYLHGSPTKRKQFAMGLTESLKAHGFAKVVNHGLSEDHIQQLFQWNERFFNIALETKLDIQHQPGPQPQRGWSCIGAENSSKLHSALRSDAKAAGIEQMDLREHFDQGAEIDVEYPNKWPGHDELPGFRSFMENHFSACHEVGTALLQAVAIALDLPVETFSAYCTGQASEQRLNHYPAIRVNEMEQGTTSRIWPHADLGVLTCLFQDSVGGLEIEDRQNPGAFFPLKPSAKSEMIVNVSETLQRWTNGVLPAGIHQVTVPHNLKGEADATIPERFSCAFFVKADRTADVGALSHFIKDGEGTKYGPMTALEYHVSRVASAYS